MFFLLQFLRSPPSLSLLQFFATFASDSLICLYDQNQHWGTRVMIPIVSMSIVTWFPNVGSNMYEVVSFLFGALLSGSNGGAVSFGYYVFGVASVLSVS